GPRQSFKLADLHLPADLPVSVPSQLVEQRPDIRAAEEQLHAASAQVGIATANTLPSFTINANAGFMSTALAHLLAPQNLFWDLAGNATQTIFDAGTLLHLLAGAKDTYNAAAWTYRGTVIGAVQNVPTPCAPCRTMPTHCARHATSNGPPRSASTSPASR